MLRKKQRRGLTDEERQRIMNEAGNVVYERDPNEKRMRFIPEIRVKNPILAHELIGSADDEEEVTEECCHVGSGRTFTSTLISS